MVHSDPPPWTRPKLSASSYSIKAEFAGSEVLLTGASGYIGSVVLEQLLRTTDVGRVHLLLRPRKGQSIQDRAHKLLQGALFHKVGVTAAFDTDSQ
jgi:fatty acyl-CoA reductase